MRYTNALLFTEEYGFTKGSFTVEDGVFRSVETGGLSEAVQAGDVNLGGKLVLPGLVDIHIHGAVGADFSDGESAGLEKMAR